MYEWWEAGVVKVERRMKPGVEKGENEWENKVVGTMACHTCTNV